MFFELEAILLVLMRGNIVACKMMNLKLACLYNGET